ncbi:MAG: TonB family protein [Bacteroidota bacterium]
MNSLVDRLNFRHFLFIWITGIFCLNSLTPNPQVSVIDSSPILDSIPPSPPPPPLPPPVNCNEIYRVVERMPLFPGAEGDTYYERKSDADMRLLEFVYSHVRYPERAVASCIEGMAVISFVIDQDGYMHSLRIVRDPGGGTGEEALRVMELMADIATPWTPGTQMGRPVSVQFNMPVRFRLEVKEDAPPCIVEETIEEASESAQSISARTSDELSFSARFATLPAGIQVRYVSDSPSTLYVFNTSGQLIWQASFLPGELSQMVPLEQRGVYIFRVETQSGGETHRIGF